MKQRDIVLGLLAPADEDPAEAVHPAMRALHHPTPRLRARLPLERLRLLPPRTDAGQRLAAELHVVAVGAVDRQAHRDAVGLDQEAALGTLFGAVGGVFPGLFPPRGVPWSCT